MFVVHFSIGMEPINRKFGCFGSSTIKKVTIHWGEREMGIEKYNVTKMTSIRFNTCSNLMNSVVSLGWIVWYSHHPIIIAAFDSCSNLFASPCLPLPSSCVCLDEYCYTHIIRIWTKSSSISSCSEIVLNNISLKNMHIELLYALYLCNMKGDPKNYLYEWC